MYVFGHHSSSVKVDWLEKIPPVGCAELICGGTLRADIRILQAMFKYWILWDMNE